MVDAHDIGTVRNAVISLFPLNCTKIKLVHKAELPVYGADRVSYPYSDIFAEHKTTPFGRLIGPKPFNPE